MLRRAGQVCPGAPRRVDYGQGRLPCIDYRYCIWLLLASSRFFFGETVCDGQDWDSMVEEYFFVSGG